MNAPAPLPPGHRLPHPDSYTYTTRWSHEDQQFVATVAEFPSLSYLAATPEHAEVQLKAVVHETLIDLAQSGGVVPAPIPRPNPWPQWQTQNPTMPPPSHFPTFPMPIAANNGGVQQVTNVNVGVGLARRGIGLGWHLIHGTLTLLTCVWGFVWIAHVIIHNNGHR